MGKERSRKNPQWLSRPNPTLLWTLIGILTINIYVNFPEWKYGRRHLTLTDNNNEEMFFYTKRFNWMGRRLNAAVPLDYTDHPDAPKLVIATIVSNHQTDVDKLCRALKSLEYLKGDVLGYPTPVLVFNDRTLSNYQLEKIVQSTDRPIAFPGVDEIDVFPDGFDPNKDNTHFNANSQWFYPKMTKFWVNTLWNHPAIGAFDFVMRMDFDTCFYEDNSHLPDFAKLHKAYHAQYVGVEPDVGRVQGLFDFVTKYMADEDILPTNPLLWQLVANTWATRKTLPLYQVSLEVIRKSLMQHKDVQKFHDAIVNREPYGIFEYGWSDHVLRFIDTALFVSNENFMTTGFQGFHNRVSCEADPPTNKEAKEDEDIESMKGEDEHDEIVIVKDNIISQDSNVINVKEQEIREEKNDSNPQEVVDTQEQNSVQRENAREENEELPILETEVSENLLRQERY